MKDEALIMALHPNGKKGVDIFQSKNDTIKPFILQTIDKHGQITFDTLCDLAVQSLLR